MEPVNIHSQANEISLKDLILKLKDWYYYLLSKWVIILSAGIIGAAVAFAYAFSKKPVYTAACTFVLEEGGTSGGLGQYAGIASMMGVDLGGGGGSIFQGDNIIELYKSRTMIEKTLLSEVDIRGKKQLLIDRYIEFTKMREDWAKKPELSNIHFKVQSVAGPTSPSISRIQDSIISRIVNDISKNYLQVIKPDKKLSIIRVEIKAIDEAFAKSFNDQIVKNVNDFYVQTKTKKSLDNVAILQQKTDSVRSVMNGAIYKAVAVADATPNVNPTHQIQRAAPMQRAQFSAETNQLILGELVKNLELAKITLRQETPLIQIVDVPVLPLEVDSASRLKATFIGLILAACLTIVLLLLKKLLQDILN